MVNFVLFLFPSIFMFYLFPTASLLRLQPGQWQLSLQVRHARIAEAMDEVPVHHQISNHRTRVRANLLSTAGTSLRNASGLGATVFESQYPIKTHAEMSHHEAADWIVAGVLAMRSRGRHARNVQLDS